MPSAQLSRGGADLLKAPRVAAEVGVVLEREGVEAAANVRAAHGVAEVESQKCCVAPLACDGPLEPVSDQRLHLLLGQRIDATRISIVLAQSVELGWKAPLRVPVGDESDVEAMHAEVGRRFLPQSVAQPVESVKQPKVTAEETDATAVAPRIEAGLAALLEGSEEIKLPPALRLRPQQVEQRGFEMDGQRGHSFPDFRLIGRTDRGLKPSWIRDRVGSLRGRGRTGS
jgi:hypothetical protein